MRFISLFLTMACVQMACSQINLNDTQKLKSYIRFLVKEQKLVNAAAETETLYQLTSNKDYAYQSIKYWLSVDSWEHAFNVSKSLTGDNSDILQSQLNLVLSPSQAIPNDKDSQYYQFIQGLIYQPRTVEETDLKMADDYKLHNVNLIIHRAHKKKRLIAGIASLLPGLGKLYIGRNMDALASFVNVGMLSALSLASYTHLGLHPVTYITAGLAAGFYIAGIVGTQASIGTNRRLAHQKLKQYALDNYKLFLLSQ